MHAIRTHTQKMVAGYPTAAIITGEWVGEKKLGQETDTLQRTSVCGSLSPMSMPLHSEQWWKQNLESSARESHPNEDLVGRYWGKAVTLLWECVILLWERVQELCRCVPKTAAYKNHHGNQLYATVSSSLTLFWFKVFSGHEGRSLIHMLLFSSHGVGKPIKLIPMHADSWKHQKYDVRNVCLTYLLINLCTKGLWINSW